LLPILPPVAVVLAVFDVVDVDADSFVFVAVFCNQNEKTVGVGGFGQIARSDFNYAARH
jgi:glyoxylate utilization-related uncharacterized protein